LTVAELPSISAITVLAIVGPAALVDDDKSPSRIASSIIDIPRTRST